MAEVTQADKDWAVDVAHALGLTAEQFTSGAADVLVQAAARHREQAVKPLVEALGKARAQFQFYAHEHLKAGKDEKAATNQAFADMLGAALRSVQS